MITLKEALITKSNIHKVKTAGLFKNPKKKDMTVGCLCMIGTGEVGIVIDQKINKDLEIFDRMDFKKNLAIVFAEDGFYNSLSYISTELLNDDLKDKGGTRDWSVKAMYVQTPPKNVFNDRDSLWSYLKLLDIEKYFH